MRSRITAAGRMSPQSKIASHGRSACALTSPRLAERANNPRLPAAGGVHAHSHHRGWQNEPTIQDCQPREECMRTHITVAGRTSQQSKVASHGRSACALTSPRLVGRGNGCQQREECVRTRITVASRENKLEKRWYQW